MEWVEITAKTVPEAIDRALDNLGVDEAEAEIEVLEEPKQGLFGRVRGAARVRARVKPKATRPKNERGRGRKRKEGRRGGNERRGRGDGRNGEARGDSSGGRSDRSRSDSGSGESGGESTPKRNGRSGDDGRQAVAKADESSSSSGRKGRQKKEPAPAEEATMEEVTTQLETFLTGLTEAFGFEGDVEIAEEDGGVLGRVGGRHGLMVGPKGRTLEAIQELARVSVQRSAPTNARIKIDVGGYRELRREALERFAADAADSALELGKDVALEPMNSADRKIVHDALNVRDDVETRSDGDEPNRRVVVVPLERPSVDTTDDDPAEAEVDSVNGDGPVGVDAVTDGGAHDGADVDEPDGSDEAEGDADVVEDAASAETNGAGPAEVGDTDADDPDGDANDDPDQEAVGS